jgi:glucose/arabinose dehydrogenase
MKQILVAAAVVFAACSSESSSKSSAPVRQGAANTNLQPAFAQQTRAPEQRSGVEIAVERIARGLNEPWAIAFMPDGRMLVTERVGRLRIVTRAGTVSEPITGLPDVDMRSQGGLLDVVPAPDFAQSRILYWSYSEPRGNGENGTSVARGRLSSDERRLEDVRVIFRQQPSWRSTGHYGSRIVFDRDGRLFVTLGERQTNESRVFAQDLSTDLGKVVRINADGSPAAGNPFAGRANARPEVWSYGHRNVQGADLNPETGELWTIEHGPQGGDEVNIARAGRNYGWPIISYGEEYSGVPVGDGITQREGMEQPLYYWDPVIAPGDMDFYRGDLFPWRGDLIIAGLRAEALVRLHLDGERVAGEERFALGIGRIRDVAESEDGALWVITDETDGGVYRLTPRTNASQ